VCVRARAHAKTKNAERQVSQEKKKAKKNRVIAYARPRESEPWRAWRRMESYGVVWRRERKERTTTKKVKQKRIENKKKFPH
jgi:hypothetical protein